MKLSAAIAVIVTVIGCSFPFSVRAWEQPLADDSLSSEVGSNRSGARLHAGVDYPVPIGTTVFAIADGNVTKIRLQPSGAGRYVELLHDDGLVSKYYHLTDLPTGVLVAVGERVEEGDPIALSGDTGAGPAMLSCPPLTILRLMRV